jgi:exosortase B
MDTESASSQLGRSLKTSWIAALVGFLAMSIPTIIDLFEGPWSSDAQGHGPIVLGLSIWLLIKSKYHISESRPTRAHAGYVWFTLCVSTLLYALGRSQDIPVFEVGSLIPITACIIWLLAGPEAVRKIWFALFFMLFMIPLPGSLVDLLTQPMKMAVSIAAETVLHAAGYPISRTGVTLQIGQYQLLVADACAGLNTLFTLEAMGLLYLNVIRHSSALRNILLAILIVPISFSANVMRVMCLTLITYYLGDEAGQGFLHGFSGMVLFLSALLLIITADTTIRTVSSRLHKTHATTTSQAPCPEPTDCAAIDTNPTCSPR